MLPMDRRERELRYGSGNTLEVILKVSERCNIACTYCYFFFSGDDSWKRNPPTISEQTATDFADFIRRAVSTYHLQRVRVILHGGEPLLLKPERIRTICRQLVESVGNATLELSVQTNAMLVSEKWIEVFSEFDIFVGVSLDGPAEVNDLARLDKRGRGTYDRVLAGIRLLFSAYEAGRISRPGLLCVINPEVPAERLYHHFVDELGFRVVDFLLPDNNYETLNRETAELFAPYMQKLFSLYRDETRPDVSIRVFDKIINSLGTAPFFNSVLRRFYSDKEMLMTVSSSGQIAHDDILRTVAPDTIATELHVGTATLSDMLNDARFAGLNDAVHSIPTACTGCKWRNACRGGDIYHRYSKKNGFDNPSIYCDALKLLYSEVAETYKRAGAPKEFLLNRLDAEELEVS